MSIQGSSFNGPFATGAHMDFGVGSAGLATLFAQGYTIAVLARTISSNWGLLGAYSDAAAASPIREFLMSNNAGGREYGDGDFSNGFPDPANLAAGLNDGTWRWYVMSKPTGAAHYRMHYADLATLTWVHGESVNAANHADVATAAVLFSTWSAYPLGLNSGDMGAICVWPSALSDGQIVASCTKNSSDLTGTVTPKAGWLLPQAKAARTIVDFTGGGADETARPFVVVSADPPGFNWRAAGEETLWLPTDKPGAGDFLDASDGLPTIATGVSFTVTATGVISAIRFYATANAATGGGGNYQVNLHEVTADDNTPAGTLLGSSVSVPSTSIVSGAWNEFPLTSPVTVQPGHAYRASVYSGTSGRYVATTGYFTGVDHTSAGGHMTAWHNGNNPVGTGTVNNGVFIQGGGSPTALPYHSTGANYWVDAVYKPTGGPAFDATRFLPFFN